MRINETKSKKCSSINIILISESAKIEGVARGLRCMLASCHHKTWLDQESQRSRDRIKPVIKLCKIWRRGLESSSLWNLKSKKIQDSSNNNNNENNYPIIQCHVFSVPTMIYCLHIKSASSEWLRISRQIWPGTVFMKYLRF